MDTFKNGAVLVFLPSTSILDIVTPRQFFRFPLTRMLHKQCDLNRLAWCGIEIATIQNDERSLPYPLSRRAAAG